MPPYIWARRSSSKQDAIKDEIQNICRRLATEELWKVFKKTVKRTRKRNGPKVENIVITTSEKISDLPRIDFSRSRNLESFKKANDYLKDGLESLRRLENRDQNKVNRDLRKEMRALELDQATFDNAVKDAEKLREHQRGQVIRFIEINHVVGASTKKLHEMTNGYFSYRELAWYLVRAKIMTAPDLWIKTETVNQIPESSVQWEYRWGSASIESDEIYAISTKGRTDYMVAVVHGGDEENPVVLDLPKCGEPGEFPCCVSHQCRDLEQHLGRIWPNYLVEHALHFRRPTDDKVLVSRFDNSVFENRTNDLYVKCKLRP